MSDSSEAIGFKPKIGVDPMLTLPELFVAATNEVRVVH